MFKMRHLSVLTCVAVLLFTGSFVAAQDVLKVLSVDDPPVHCTNCSIPAGSVIILNQPPDGSNGVFSDFHCDICVGFQASAGNFKSNAGIIEMIKIWGGCVPGNVCAPHNFSICIRLDNGGLPGAALCAEVMAGNCVATGVVQFGVDEWECNLDIVDCPVGGGTKWIEIYDDSGTGTDNWFWETGTLGPVGGVAGSAFRSNGTWNLSPDIESATAITGTGGASQIDDRDGDGVIECCETEDVLCGVGQGRIDQRAPNSGALIRQLNTTSGSNEQTGMCFDTSGNLYSTNFTAGSMTYFDMSSDPVNTQSCGTVLQHPFNQSPFGLYPKTCVVHPNGNVFSGEVDGAEFIREWSPSPGGNLVNTFAPLTGPRGVDHFDLDANGTTFLYTSEGNTIHRFDRVSGQLTDFATAADGLVAPCFALRIRPNTPAGTLASGEVLVACFPAVVRLDGNGNFIQSYPAGGFNPPAANLFALNLDPDGAHFWTADILSGEVYKIDIASGAQANNFLCPPNPTVAGLALCGELLVIEECDPDPRSQGYWHRQCLGVPAGEGGIDPGREGHGPGSPTEPNFVPDVMDCGDQALEEAGIFGVMTCEGMDADPPHDPCEKAVKQLTASLLNICTDRLQNGCEIDVSPQGCTIEVSTDREHGVPGRSVSSSDIKRPWKAAVIRLLPCPTRAIDVLRRRDCLGAVSD